MNDKFTLEELSRLLASRHRMEETDADAFVAGFFALIEECLKKERYVRIKGLGTFKLVDVEPRTIVDVNSGEKKNIASYSKISFTPEASLRDAVNKPFSHFETVILNENTHFDDIDETEVESSDASDSSDLSDLNDSPDLSDMSEMSGLSDMPGSSGLSDSSDLYDSSDSNGSSDLNDSFDRSESEAAEGVEEMSAIENYSNQSLETETEAESESESESESKVDVSGETVAEGGMQSEVELESKIEAKPEVRAESEVRDNSEVRAESEVEFSKKTGHGPIPTYRMEEDPEQSASGKKRFVTPWCMIATVLFVGIIVGGGIVWSLLSGRRYIPEEVMKYISENKILSDTVDNRKSVVRSGTPDTVSVSASESVSAFETDSVLKSDSVPGTDVVPETDVVPGTYPALGSDVDSEHKSEPDSSDSEQKDNVKYLTDTVRYKIVGTMGTHTIVKGNTLAKVAYNFYRNKKLWPYIVKHNKDIIKNPDNVPIGTVIKVPMLEPIEK